MKLTKKQAARFLLLRQGLLGDYAYCGKPGIMEYIRGAGCIQYDPIDPCGRNGELVLQSRVKGFEKSMLHQLLYRDSMLMDYWDKCMAILPVENWPFYERRREEFDSWDYYAHPALEQAMAMALEMIAQQGPCSSADMPETEKIRWPWGKTAAARAALELLYFRGKLVISDKKGTRKYYDLTQRHIPSHLLEAGDPFLDQDAYWRWHVARRIGSVGLLWDRRSDAYLGVTGLDAGARARAVQALLEAGTILPAQVEGIKWPLYYLKSHEPLMEQACSQAAHLPRCECIAPLDNLMWDRNLIEAVFGFAYRWEIYTPAPKRQYGYYVLPLLYGEEFVGRIEPVADAKSGILTVKHMWLEKKMPKRAINACVKRLAAFNGCKEIRYIND